MGQAALKLEPKGEWLSTSEIARRCGIHRQTCTARLDDLGYEPDEERSTPKNQVYWFDEELEYAVKSAKDTSTAVRIRKDRADAMIKELKLAEARRDLVPLGDAIERMQAVLSQLYKEFGLHQPKRLAARLAKAKTAPEVSKILKGDNDKIFARLREKDDEFVPVMKKVEVRR